ncbi:MAG: hypothetical protein Tsb0010_09650 [Parvularculaceae bacterium]
MGRFGYTTSMDDDDLDQLEDEVPRLDRLRRFARSLAQMPWFANVGAPPSPAVRAMARDYCDYLGFPEAEIALLSDWEEAANAAQTQDYNAPAWEAEELIRADLTEAARSALSPEAFDVAFAFIAAEAARAVAPQASRAWVNWGGDDEDALRAAEGAAIAACNGAALILAGMEARPDIDVETHPFALRFRLFELGRWPIGVAGASFNLF